MVRADVCLVLWSLKQKSSKTVNIADFYFEAVVSGG